jgi:ankyrin repeat protein
VLNLRSLAQKGTAQEVTKFLETLPDSYAGIYIFYMKEIEAQDHASRTRAFQVLSWLSHALGSLTIDAIKHALSVRTGDREFHDDAQPDADNLVSVCCNFVMVDQKTKTIRLVHGTAEEYLKTIGSSKFPASHSIISSTCLTYLSLGQFTGLCLSQGNVERRSLSYPFYRYAAENWSKHVALDNLESSLQDSIIEFLESRQRYGADEAMARHRRSAWGADGGTPWTDWNRMSIQRRDLPLHAAATYGLRKTVAFLLKERGYRVDQLNNFGETALHRAAQVGQASTMDELLVNGADVNAKVLHHYLGQATAMILASSCLQMDTVRVLLNRGVDVNASDPQNRLTPLHFAASMSTDLARFVLEYGADPNLTALRPPIFPERGPMTSLHLCVYLAHAYDGAIDRARLLLDSGAHINKQTGLGSTALHLAIAGGHQGLVRILLDREANVYLTNGEGKSPIQLAQELGYFSWVKDWIQPSILEDILHNAPALIQAIWAIDIERVRNLLDQDIDITERDQNGKSPWDYCVLSANIQIANMLADHMDSRSLPDYIGSDAFETAVPRMTAFDYSDNTTWERTLQICQRLVGYRMAFNGNLDFARGRSPVGNYNKTCLIWAAELGRLAEVEFLLDCGSDVNAQDMFGSTAAGYAIANNNEAIAKILIDHGADLSIKDRFGRTPLHTADGSSIPSMRASLEAALAKRDAKTSQNEKEDQAVVHAGYSAGASHDTEFR